jgi:NDP-sugar pyrophosphorylase family protein
VFDQLAEAGVRQVVLCTGYMGEQIERAIGPEYASLQVRYSREEKPLGTAGALRKALGLSLGESFLALNGDSFVDTPLKAFYGWHRERGFAGSVLLTRVHDSARFGSVQVDPNGRLLGFAEKAGASGPGWINAGVYVLSHELITSVPEGQAVSLERDMLPAWAKSGLGGYPVHAPFIDIGTPESYAQASRFFQGGEA